MSKKNSLNYLNQTFQLAQDSVKNGNHPFGAVLVHSNKVVCKAENEVNTLNDVTAHAELRLVQKAQKILTRKELSESILYSSTEPCAMCSGAIYWSGIKKVIYGCSTKDLFNIVNEGLYIESNSIFKYSTTEVDSIQKGDKKDFIQQHHSFWKKDFSHN